MSRTTCRTLVFLALLGALWAPTAGAQEILLDKMEQAGELTCFQSFDDEKVWYYLPDRPRIAEENGAPQFSFLKFVTNEDTGGEGGTTTAQGGGIVHFLVEFNVPDNMVRRAEQELSRRVPGARIAGPIIYRSGTFALVSSVAQEGSEYTSKLVGLGKAPILEGHKAAVSILLTREGATLLWETFKGAAPDISLQFEMTVAGYREPFEAELVGDWSLIAQNKTFAMGMKSTWVGMDIQNSMKELRQENAIRLTVKGGDEASEKLLNLAYGKLVEYIFEQVSNPAVNQTLADDPNLFSNFEKAAAFNTAERAQATAENRGGTAAAVMGVRRPPPTYPAATRHQSQTGSTTAATTTTGRPSTTGQPGAQPTTTGKTATTAGQPATAAKTAGATAGAARKNPYDLTANRRTPPSFSLLASYRIKRFNSSGTFRLSFNKFAQDNLAFPIAENIGDIYDRVGDDPRFFREVNLDDPVYKQRELIVFLDGQDIEDFDKYVNFVTVTMQKEHENGDATTDEVRIDRNNFQSRGNDFRLLYGWKGDNNRGDWLHYRYKAHWSFHGGSEWESDWQDTDQFSVAVAPPHRYRRIELEADPELLDEAGVRMVTVKFYYDFFGQERMETMSMRNNPEELGKAIEYSHEPDKFDYEYEITWRLRGNKSVSSGRLKGAEDILFVDELPEEG